VLLILGWPPERSQSLGIKTIRFLADPQNALPVLPDPLPLGLDDNGDAVAAHDAIEAQYYLQYSSSAATRFRMRLKAVGDPFDPTTQRQILAAIGIVSALLVWRLNRKPSSR
jgi:hypothetical protein